MTMFPHKRCLGGGQPNVHPIIISIGNDILGAKIVPQKRDTQNVKGWVWIVDCVWNVIFKRLPCIRCETNSNRAGIHWAGCAVSGLNWGMLNSKRSHKLTPVIAYYARGRIPSITKGIPSESKDWEDSEHSWQTCMDKVRAMWGVGTTEKESSFLPFWCWRR